MTGIIRKEVGHSFGQCGNVYEYNLHVTRPVGECFQRLLSNPAFALEELVALW